MRGLCSRGSGGSGDSGIGKALTGQLGKKPGEQAKVATSTAIFRLTNPELFMDPNSAKVSAKPSYRPSGSAH
eukprot:SAG22_NODE_360_length_11744_cov_37.781623_9_plen_72_part_00